MSFEENSFLPHAMKLLKHILDKIKENEDFPSALEACKESLKEYITDLVYACLITLRDKQCIEEDVYTNQCSENVVKFGVVRMRALELLKMMLYLAHEGSAND